MKKIIAWAGFINGRIDLDLTIGGMPPHRSDDKIYGAVYGARREARKCYQDVRKIEILEVK